MALAAAAAGDLVAIEIDDERLSDPPHPGAAEAHLDAAAVRHACRSEPRRADLRTAAPRRLDVNRAARHDDAIDVARRFRGDRTAGEVGGDELGLAQQGVPV